MKINKGKLNMTIINEILCDDTIELPKMVIVKEKRSSIETNKFIEGDELFNIDEILNNSHSIKINAGV